MNKVYGLKFRFGIWLVELGSRIADVDFDIEFDADWDECGDEGCCG
jgi:hypothetical protein